MAKALGVFLLPILISLSLVTSAVAASVEEFYKGKTIHFVVGVPPVEAMIRTQG